jgi:hypothetical protein
MAAITVSECTVSTVSVLPGMNFYKIVTPATADDGDTLDASTLIPETIVSATVICATDGLLPATKVSAAKVITIPGATDNEARTIYVLTTR